MIWSRFPEESHWILIMEARVFEVPYKRVDRNRRPLYLTHCHSLDVRTFWINGQTLIILIRALVKSSWEYLEKCTIPLRQIDPSSKSDVHCKKICQKCSPKWHLCLMDWPVNRQLLVEQLSKYGPLDFCFKIIMSFCTCIICALFITNIIQSAKCKCNTHQLTLPRFRDLAKFFSLFCAYYPNTLWL